MSHSSGIEVSQNLHESFTNANHNATHRFLKVQIMNETKLDLVGQSDNKGPWEQDFDLVPSVLDSNDASYILYRTDKTNEVGHLWYCLCYVPDKAPVRQKMLYASSRANLKSGLGSQYFLDDIFGTSPGDFDNKGFKAYEKHQNAGVPLTESEKLKEEELEYGLFTGGAGTSNAYAHGVAFPVEDNVYAAFDKLKDDQITYIQIGIDVTNEKVNLKEELNIPIDEVTNHIPIDEPRFHFYKWNHSHDGEDFDSLVFVYTSPDGSKGTKSAPVKLRMLYSTSKANVAGIAEAKGFQIAAKLEISSGAEFSQTDLLHSLHPPKAEEKKTFAKPKPKATRKLIKS